MSQHLVDVLDSNKHELLKNAIQSSVSRQATAREVLRQLERLSTKPSLQGQDNLQPGLATKFGLKTVALEKLKLRLLSYPAPGATVEHFTSYIIISYCWHKPDWPEDPRGPPLAEGWEIYQPMVDKILSLRLSDSEGVWIDKLCIRQANEFAEEKQIAIGSMDVVYRSARRMLTLLEDVKLDHGEHLAGKLLSEMYEEMAAYVAEHQLEGGEKGAFVAPFTRERLSHIRTTLESCGYDMDREIEKLGVRILTARWFTRAWCAHEIRVVPQTKVNNPLILCFGSDGSIVTFEFRFVIFLCAALYKFDPAQVSDDILDTSGKSSRPPSLFKLRNQLFLLHSDGKRAEISLMQHLFNVSNMGCEYKQDLISIALNSSDLPLTFVGTLDEPNDIYWIFSLLSIASGDATSLMMSDAHPTFADQDRATRRGPRSWLKIPLHSFSIPRLELMEPGAVSHVTREYIELDILLFQASPQNPTDGALASAKSLVDDYDLKTLAATMAQEQHGEFSVIVHSVEQNPEFQRVSKEALSEFLVTMLGFAYDNGPVWTTRFPRTLQEMTKGSDWAHGEFQSYDARLVGAATTLLWQLMELTPAESPEALEDVVRFLACVLDEKLTFLTATSRRLRTAEEDFAITDRVSNKSWIAVPVATANASASNHRAWIVEPFDPSGPPEDMVQYTKLQKIVHSPTCIEYRLPINSSDAEDVREQPDAQKTAWRLRRQHVIYGCQPLKADGKHVVRLARQRVYGADDYDWRALDEYAREEVAREEGKEPQECEGVVSESVD